MCLLGSFALARADALDDTLARFIDDKFPQTEKAVGELAASGAPNAAAILQALSDGRLFIDPASHAVLLRDGSGALLLAKTGAPAADVKSDRLKKLRVNNGVRTAIDAALGSLGLSNPDPAKRVAAADAVFKSRDAKALPGVETALAKESDPRAAQALRLARAAILVLRDDSSSTDRIASIEILKSRGDQDDQPQHDRLRGRGAHIADEDFDG